MSDDGELERAFGALRDEVDGHSDGASDTLSRVLFESRRRAQQRRRMVRRWVPLAAVLVGSSAWAAGGTRLVDAVRTVVAPFAAPREVEPSAARPSNKVTAKRPPVAPSTPADVPVETPPPEPALAPPPPEATAPPAPSPSPVSPRFATTDATGPEPPRAPLRSVEPRPAPEAPPRVAANPPPPAPDRAALAPPPEAGPARAPTVPAVPALGLGAPPRASGMSPLPAPAIAAGPSPAAAVAAGPSLAAGPARGAPPAALPAAPARPPSAAPAGAPAVVAGAVAAGAPATASNDDPALRAETDLFERAHRAHFSGADPAAAVNAWGEYLHRYPKGRFAPEASYNRAIALVRAGRRGEACAALRPYASGAGYRRREATELVKALGCEKAP